MSNLNLTIQLRLIYNLSNELDIMLHGIEGLLAFLLIYVYELVFETLGSCDLKFSNMYTANSSVTFRESLRKCSGICDDIYVQILTYKFYFEYIFVILVPALKPYASSHVLGNTTNLSRWGIGH